MTRCRVLAVLPYEGLKEVVLRVAEGFPELDVRILIGNLREKERIERRVAENDFDVVVTRGGLCEYVKALTQKPVTKIEITAYDIARVIKIVEGYQGTVAIAVQRSMVLRLRAICETIRPNALFFAVDGYENTKQQVKKILESGCSMIIGDTATWECTRMMGFPAVLIASGQEGVFDALSEVLKKWKEQQRSHYLNEELRRHLLLRHSWMEITDHSGDVLVSTFAPEDADALKIRARMYDEWDARQTDRSLQQDRKIWSIHMSEAQHDGTLFRTLSLHETAIPERRSGALTLMLDPVPSSYSSILMNSRDRTSIMLAEQIKTYAVTNLPVLICGESGTSKSGVALELHRQSRMRHAPFAEVACDCLSEQDVEDLFRSEGSELRSLSAYTIYLNGVDRLSIPVQKVILSFLPQPKIERHTRLLMATGEDLAAMVKQGVFLKRFYSKMCELTIHVPPLRERKGDIQLMVGMAVASYNMRSTGKILGLEADAVRALEEYPWPGNAEQFYRVIQAAMSCCTEPYVSKRVIQNVLTQERERQAVTGYAKIDLHSTLEEMEDAIIRQVLKEENNNQSKAARRLGIGRSTLMRHLKMNQFDAK